MALWHWHFISRANFFFAHSNIGEQYSTIYICIAPFSECTVFRGFVTWFMIIRELECNQNSLIDISCPTAISPWLPKIVVDATYCLCISFEFVKAEKYHFSYNSLNLHDAFSLTAMSQVNWKRMSPLTRTPQSSESKSRITISWYCFYCPHMNVPERLIVTQYNIVLIACLELAKSINDLLDDALGTKPTSSETSVPSKSATTFNLPDLSFLRQNKYNLTQYNWWTEIFDQPSFCSAAGSRNSSVRTCSHCERKHSTDHHVILFQVSELCNSTYSL